MRVLQIGSDRSTRGILNPRGGAIERQKAYGERFGNLDIIAFSLRSDGAAEYRASDHVAVYPTSSRSRVFYGFDALRLFRRLPRPDVISAQDPFEAGLVAWVMAMTAGIPLHIQLHTDPFDPAYARLSILNRFRVTIANFVLARASRIRVVSDRVRERVERRTKAPVTVLPIYVDIGKYRNSMAPPDLAQRFSRFSTKLLVVSRLEKEKNVELAVRSFAQAAPPDTCLIVVAEGSERACIESLVQQLKVADRVFLEGSQDPIPYYALADLVLVTSHYEGYGLVIIEALAAGKPVLATDVGVAREAGAIIAGNDYAQSLSDWIASAPRVGALKSYPYASFEEYADAYANDIKATK